MSRPKHEPTLVGHVSVALFLLGVGLASFIPDWEKRFEMAVVFTTLGGGVLLVMIGIALYRAGRGDYS